MNKIDILHVAVCQMTSVDDVSVNFKAMNEQLTQILDRQKPIDLISFPENSLFFRVDMQSGEKYALKTDHHAFTVLANFCKTHQVMIHLGSVPLWIEGRIHNVTVLIDDQGKVTHPYSKMHLFDIYLKDKEPILESDYYERGWGPQIFDWRGFRFGLSICYDLRFSELFNYYARNAVDILLIPAAFLPVTGQAHWEILLRARAIECEAYVLAATQGGLHKSVCGETQRSTYGHSMIVEPWGDVVAVADSQTIIFGEISRFKINQMREQIPMQSHRRMSSSWDWV